MISSRAFDDLRISNVVGLSLVQDYVDAVIFMGIAKDFVKIVQVEDTGEYRQL